MRAFLVLVTTPGPRVSERISQGLLKGKLAACVNTLPGVRSRYLWKGRIETAKEELLLIKTGAPRLRKLIEWVRKNHPYSVCEVIALPITAGNRPYLEWIGKSLA